MTTPPRTPDAGRGRLRFLAGLLAAFLAALALALALHGAIYREFSSHKGYFYDDVPLLTTADGYYYLRLSAEEGQLEYMPRDDLRAGRPYRPEHVPLLVHLTAWGADVSGLQLDVVAFGLSAVLASLSVAAYFLWAGALGIGLGAALMGFWAAAAGTCSAIFFLRSTIGRFDTDCLNLFFLVAASFCAWRFTVVRAARRWAWLAGLAATLALFAWWWPQVGAFSFAPVLGAYALSVFVDSSRAERMVKFVLLAAGLVLAALVLFGNPGTLPGPLAGYVNEARKVLAFITDRGTSFFPRVGRSIDELNPLVLGETGMWVAGWWPTLVAGLIGAVWLAVRRPDAALFAFAPTLVWAVLAVFARRFVIFLVPVHALGLGYLLGVALPEALARRKMWLRWTVPALLGVALLLMPAARLAQTRVRPPFTAQDVALALTARGASTRSAEIWNWWDTGYFLQYWAQRRTFIDGGNQIPSRNFISYRPLATDDPVLARNWIRFFAARDLDGLNRLVDQLGDNGAAIAFLNQALAAPDRLAEVLEAHGMAAKQSLEAWQHFLFPPAEVYLTLTPDYFAKGWWYVYGSWTPGAGGAGDGAGGLGPEAPPPTVFAAKDELLVNAKMGIVAKRGGERALNLSGIMEVKANGETKFTPAGRDPGFVLVDVQGSPSYMLLDPRLVHTLVGRLLYTGHDQTPGFKEIFYHPFVGGVWRVD